MLSMELAVKGWQYSLSVWVGAISLSMKEFQKTKTIYPLATVLFSVQKLKMHNFSKSHKLPREIKTEPILGLFVLIWMHFHAGPK